jgi:DNA-binding transcriptional LysR family regulator
MLDISQPAVTQLLAALSRSLDLKLFDHRRGRLIATAEAKALYVEVERMFIGLERIERKAASLRGREGSEINVAVLPALGYSLLPRVVRRFQELYPGSRVRLQTRNSNAVKDLVASGEADIGFAASEVDARGVVASVFCRTSGVCIMPRTHQLAAMRQIGPEDLDGVDFVALNPEDVARQQLDRLLDEQGARPRIVVETPYSAGVCALVLEGVGIGVINPITAAQFDRGGLEIRPFRPAIQFDTLLLFPHNAAPSKLVSDFVSLARSAVAEVLGRKDRG